jgi:hypothetical protein
MRLLAELPEQGHVLSVRVFAVLDSSADLDWLCTAFRGAVVGQPAVDVTPVQAIDGGAVAAAYVWSVGPEPVDDSNDY